MRAGHLLVNSAINGRTLQQNYVFV